MPVVVTKPNTKASESLIELAYALSGVRQQQQEKQQKQGSKGLFGRIFGLPAEEKAEVKVE